MPYTTNPMSQYNKNNPFVILSKRMYDEIMDTLQSVSKTFVKEVIVEMVLALIYIGATIASYFLFDSEVFKCTLIITIVYIILIGLYSFYYFKIMKYYMHEHEGIIEFDRISNLELNEIQKIGNEDILSCLHKLYNLQGSLRVHASNIQFTGLILIIVQILELILWVSLRIF